MAMIFYGNFSKLLLCCTIPTKSVNGYEICICVRGRKRERERERERKKEGEGERGREREWEGREAGRKTCTPTSLSVVFQPEQTSMELLEHLGVHQ